MKLIKIDEAREYVQTSLKGNKLFLKDGNI